MKKNTLSKITFLLALVILTGCKVKKPATPSVIIPPTETKASFSKAEVLKKISDQQINFNTIVIKSKAELNMGNNNNSVSMNIRMQKDKVIWVSISAFAGIEVARAFITPDSIKILNRLEGSVTKKPFSYIYQFASKQVDFKTLQDLFVGNALAGTLSPTSTVDVNAGQPHISGDLSGLTFALIFNGNSNLLQSKLTDTRASQALTVNYGEYGMFSGQAIPQAVDIKSVVASKNVGIKLKYNYVGLNENTEFPFTVPNKFTVKD